MGSVSPKTLCSTFWYFMELTWVPFCILFHCKMSVDWYRDIFCYDWNLWKCKHLSRISTVLQDAFRTGLVFLSWPKWVQGVVCYDQSLQKHKYLNRDKFSVTSKVNYISEDLLPVMVISRLFCSEVVVMLIVVYHSNTMHPSSRLQFFIADEVFLDKYTQCNHVI